MTQSFCHTGNVGNKLTKCGMTGEGATGVGERKEGKKGGVDVTKGCY